MADSFSTRGRLHNLILVYSQDLLLREACLLTTLYQSSLGDLHLDQLDVGVGKIERADTHVHVGQGARGDKADIDGEEGVGVTLTLELERSRRVLGVDRVNGPDKGVALGAPVCLARDRG